MFGGKFVIRKLVSGDQVFRYWRLNLEVGSGLGVSIKGSVGFRDKIRVSG